MAIQFGISPVKPGTLLGRLETYLQGQTKVAADLVFLSVAPDELHLRFPPGDQFVTIFPARFPPWQGVVTGAGSNFATDPDAENLGFDSEIIITAFCRFNIDQELRSSQLVQNTSYGVMDLFASVLKAMQFWTAPLDAPNTNKSYLREYMRMSGAAQMLPRNYKDTFWTLLKIPFEARFSAELG